MFSASPPPSSTETVLDAGDAAPIALHTIDLHYLGIPRAIAAFVLVARDGSPVLIETGPASTLEALERGLAIIGFRLADIRHALVTHIHLDHAGAAGRLAREHGTRIWVHEFGARHLVDPTRLIDSATRIYGSQMDRLWGRMTAVPEALVSRVHDGDVIDLHGLRFTAIDTPGHARHHHAYALQGTVSLRDSGNLTAASSSTPPTTTTASSSSSSSSSPSPSPSLSSAQRICFVGDVAGICVPGIPEPPQGSFIAIPTPPPEFHLEAWESSIDRLLGMNFQAIFLTHYGVRHHVAEHLKLVRRMVRQQAMFIGRMIDADASGGAAPDSFDRLLQAFIAFNRELARRDGLSDEDFARYVSTNLLTMNVQGLLRYWLTSRAERSA